MKAEGRAAIVCFILLFFSLQACWGQAPLVQAGPYTVKLESTARVLDFAQPEENRARTLVTLSIEGPAEAMGRLSEIALEPAAADDQGSKLVFQQVNIVEKPAALEPRQPSARVAAQVWFSAADAGASALEVFSASLVSYEKKEGLRVDFLSVAGEKPAARSLEGLTLSPEFLGVQEARSGKVYQVKVEVKGPAEKSADSLQWTNEQVELIDAEGQPKAALSTTRTYRYDEAGQAIARTITATFTYSPRSPRGFRYRVERLQGVQTRPYRFENVALP